MKGYIYAFIDEETFEIYVGSTVNTIRVRYQKHLTDLRMFLGLTSKGSRNFRHSFDILYNNRYKIVCLHTLDNVNKQTLNLIESMYIIKFKKQGLKLVNKGISSKEALLFDYRNFGLNEINFAAKTLFPRSELLRPSVLCKLYP